MPSYSDSVILQFDSPSSGNAAPTEYIEVKQNGLTATIYSDAALTVPKTNPFFTDNLGYYSFFAASGDYEIQVGNPAQRTFPITLGGAGGGGDTLPVGANLLSNVNPGGGSGDWIARDVESTQLTANYPILAGTDGYPIIGDPVGYTAGANYSNGNTVDLIAASFQKYSFIDSNNIMYSNTYATGAASGKILFSADNGVTDSLMTTPNTINLLHFATDEASIIVGVGVSARVEVFDYTTRVSTGNTTAGSLSLSFVDYDSDSSLWIAADIRGNVYTSTSPSTTWNAAGTIVTEGATPSLYYDKTANGYIIYNTVTDDIFFTSTLLGSPTATKVIVNPNANDFIFKRCSDFNSSMQFGKMLIVNEQSASRQLYRSSDGGQTFLSIAFSGMTTNNIIDMMHIEGDVWVLLDSAGEIYFTTDFGDNWSAVGMPAGGAPFQIYKNQQNDVIVIHDNVDLRSIADATQPPVSEFMVTVLESPNNTDKYYVKGR